MTAPDYFTYLRAFDAFTIDHPELLPSDVVLYLALLMLANKYRRFTFPAKREDILARTHLNPHTYGRSRQRLSDLGLLNIEAGVGGTKMATFTILPPPNRVYFNTDINTDISTETNTVVNTDTDTETNTNNNLYPYPIPKEEVVPASPPSKKVADNIIMDWQPTEEKKPTPQVAARPSPEWPRSFTADELHDLITTGHQNSWEQMQKNYGEQVDVPKALRDWCKRNAGENFNDRAHPRNVFRSNLVRIAEAGGNRQPVFAGSQYEQRTQTMKNALDRNDYDANGKYIGPR